MQPLPETQLKARVSNSVSPSLQSHQIASSVDSTPTRTQMHPLPFLFPTGSILFQ